MGASPPRGEKSCPRDLIPSPRLPPSNIHNTCARLNRYSRIQMRGIRRRKFPGIRFSRFSNNRVFFTYYVLQQMFWENAVSTGVSWTVRSFSAMAMPCFILRVFRKVISNILQNFATTKFPNFRQCRLSDVVVHVEALIVC